MSGIGVLLPLVSAPSCLNGDPPGRAQGGWRPGDERAWVAARRRRRCGHWTDWPLWAAWTFTSGRSLRKPGNSLFLRLDWEHPRRARVRPSSSRGSLGAAVSHAERWAQGAKGTWKVWGRWRDSRARERRGIFWTSPYKSIQRSASGLWVCARRAGGGACARWNCNCIFSRSPECRESISPRQRFNLRLRTALVLSRKVILVLNAPQEACLPSCHDLEKETVFVSLPGIPLLKNCKSLSLFDLLGFFFSLSFSSRPSFIFLQSFSVCTPTIVSGGHLGLTGDRRWYLLSQRTRPSACTWPSPRSLSSSKPPLLESPCLRNTRLMMPNPRDLASRESFEFRSL